MSSAERKLCSIGDEIMNLSSNEILEILSNAQRQKIVNEVLSNNEKKIEKYITDFVTRKIKSEVCASVDNIIRKEVSKQVYENQVQDKINIVLNDLLTDEKTINSIKRMALKNIKNRFEV